MISIVAKIESIQTCLIRKKNREKPLRPLCFERGMGLGEGRPLPGETKPPETCFCARCLEGMR